MKILILSFFFPPYNKIGGVRVGKTAKYLKKRGHSVKVITAVDQCVDKSLNVELEPGCIEYTKWHNVEGIKHQLNGVHANRNSTAKGALDTNKSSVARKLKHLYKSAISFPDNKIGWLPFAYRRAKKIISAWAPDVIISSGPPFTAHIVASMLSKKFDVPWIADYRDLWTQSHYYPYSGVRKKVETKLEEHTIKHAAGLVTVSEPLAETLMNMGSQPVRVVMNGYDPVDYSSAFDKTPFFSTSEDNVLRIVYTGGVYKGRRDPTPLFRAVGMLGELQQNVKIIFYSSELEVIKEMAQSHDILHLVELHPPVPYYTSLQIQTTADVLLLLLWFDNKEEIGVYTGKLFEYFGARRPILCIGYPENVASSLVLERDAGFASVNSEDIAVFIKQTIIDKQLQGKPILPLSKCLGLSRSEQTSVLEAFINEIVAVPPAHSQT